MQSTATPSPPTAPSLRELGYYDEDDLAGLLDIKAATLRNWRSQNIGPSFTRVHGNRVAYPIDEVRVWLKTRTVQPKRPATLIDGRKKRARAASAKS